MSVTMPKAEGVTVVTLTSDPQSVCPPLCQILKGLCYSPVCCSVSQDLRRVHRSSWTVLGMMVGLPISGLGTILFCSGGGYWNLTYVNMYPLLLGQLIVFFGTLFEKYPSQCLVIINVVLNVSGVAFAIAAIVLYSINMAHIRLQWMCDNDDYDSRHRPTTAYSPGREIMREKCLEGKDLILTLLRSINAVLIVLSALELCLFIGSAVFGIKALRNSEKGEEKTTADPEHYKPLLVADTSPCTV